VCVCVCVCVVLYVLWVFCVPDAFGCHIVGIVGLPRLHLGDSEFLLSVLCPWLLVVSLVCVWSGFYLSVG